MVPYSTQDPADTLHQKVTVTSKDFSSSFPTQQLSCHVALTQI